MSKGFVATRAVEDGTQTMISENGFIYVYAAGSFTANCICDMKFLSDNRARFVKAGWKFPPKKRK
jgi:hypothetical protein